MFKPLLLIAGCIPALILLAAVSIDRWRRKRRGERQSLTENLLRPAGYSLQCKLEDLNYDFTFLFMGAFVFALLVIIFPQTRPTDIYAPFVSVIIFGLTTAVCTVLALRKLYQIRAYRMGLVGEQAVAEELQRLLPLGYQVFHDLTCENGISKWNIDHVAVGPSGVFAIETKYRTKKPGRNGGPAHEATFDGNRIEFASGDYDQNAVGQAKANSDWLAKMLSKATSERVIVQPIVALPGWFVTLRANSDVKVLSGKQVSGFISKEQARLSPEIIQRISYQLEQRCRDVEI